MNPDTSKGASPSPQEVATIMDWIDGSLSPEAAFEFELRLSADRELAAQVEALSNLDALVRRESRSQAKTGRSAVRWGTWIALAAAAALVIAIGSRFFATARVQAFEVALAPSFALAEDWTRQVPGLEGASAPGIGVSRGANSKVLTADEFLRLSAPAEAALISSALEAKQRELVAGWFVIPIELPTPASVVVLGFPEHGPAQRLFPNPEGASPSEASPYLAAGRQLLPSARAVEGPASQTLDYRPGFLVPLGAKTLTLLVGVRARAMDAAQLAELDGWIAGERSVERALKRLDKAGFSVQTLSVREPK